MILYTQESVISSSRNITGLIDIRMQRRIFLIIFLTQGEQKVSIYKFVDADIEGNKSTWRSQIGLLIFVNKAPIHWFIKRQETVEASNFGAEFCAMKAGVGVVEVIKIYECLE